MRSLAVVGLLVLASVLGGCASGDDPAPLHTQPSSSDGATIDPSPTQTTAAQSDESDEPNSNETDPGSTPPATNAPSSNEPADDGAGDSVTEPSNIACPSPLKDPPESWDDIRRSDGRFQVPVQVPVYLMGFEADVAAMLDFALNPLSVDQSWQRSPLPRVAGHAFVGFPSESIPLPLVPEANFEIVRLPDSDLEAFLEATGEGPQRDGNAAERWASDRIEDVCGTLEASAFFFVHTGETGHAYRYTYSDGTLDSLRIFGGSTPVIVFDASAASSDYADEEPHSYSAPLSNSEPTTAYALADAVRDGAIHRALQGSIYAPALESCHAVTILYLVRSTAASDPAGQLGAAMNAMDVPAIKSAFARITGQTVHVDLKVLRLPVDDPVLDSLYRGIALNLNAVGVEGIVAGVFLNQARGWIEDNFDSYHVDHPGCAEYLSTILYGDLGDLSTWGIALYEDGGSHRVSFGTASEAFRTLGIDWETHLVLHETGHLFGLAHPQDDREATDATSWAWNGVVSLMSYQIQERTKAPGMVDPVNLARNRAGFAVAAADKAGVLETEAGGMAFALLIANDWDAATAQLLVAIDAHGPSSGE